jgi:hypothetical protein
MVFTMLNRFFGKFDSSLKRTHTLIASSIKVFSSVGCDGLQYDNEIWKSIPFQLI